jgi:hypothetical protein
MKTKSLLLITLLILAAACGRRAGTKNESVAVDTVTVADTGFTGIKQYYSGPNLVYEATLKNGVRHGLMKSFYQDGKVRTTFWYENGLREDSAKWYHPDGKLFRSTPYKRDTIDGIQVQYFTNGRVRAKIGYEKGYRNFFFEEYLSNGRVVDNYPDVIVKTRDSYNTNGTYNISLELSNASTRVNYVRGDFSKGVYDTTAVASIRTTNGIGNLTLRKQQSPTKPYIEVLAEILTGHGNRYLSVKRIDLPYNDLN